ncbi:MAG: hypothetical protein M3081_07805 [Gemmatimonadota bacterium]|nr:hypothetical protein [Gemmatimonadota bacterium]
MKRNVVSLTIVLALGAALGVPSCAVAQAAQQQVAPQDNPEERAKLEQQFRAQIAQIVRQRLQLSDDQFRQLLSTNQRYEGQRRDLIRQEREVLQGLRDEQLSATPNQGRVSTLIDKRLQLEQQRLAITQQEQHELGGFLTPVQRAQYAALQEQIRRRLQEFRRRQTDPALQPNAAEKELRKEERQERKAEARPRVVRPNRRP